MQNLASTIKQNDLDKMIALLSLAIKGATNQQQSQVYQQLSQVQTNQLSYIYLAFILCNRDFDNNIRSMAGLTLKSALGRNKHVLEQQSYTLIRNAILENYTYQNNGQLNTAKGIIISQLAIYNHTKIDFQILYFLTSRIAEKDSKALQAIIILLQDLRFNNENFEIFGNDQFVRFMSKLIESLQSIFSFEMLKLDAMKCMNLIIYPLPQSLLCCLQGYIGNVLVPAILSANNKQVLIGLQGLCTVAQSKRNYISRDTISILIDFNSNDKQIKKVQANLWIEIVDADQQEVLAQFIDPLLKKLIGFLLITQQDIKNIMEQDSYNPQGNATHDQEEPQTGMLMRGAQFTLRKAAVISIERLSLYHSTLIWQKGAPYISLGLKSQNWKQCQAIVLFIGSIAEQVIQEIKGSFQQLIKILVIRMQKNQSCYLIASILWTFQKLSELIITSEIIFYDIFKIVLQCLQHGDKGNKSDHIIIEAGFACLDELVQQKQRDKQNIHAQAIYQMIKIALVTIQSNKFRGSTLFSAFKLLSIIVQQCAIAQQIADIVIKTLCQKWSSNQGNQHMVCPLIECLVLLCQKNKQSFSKYSNQIFMFSMNVMNQTCQNKQSAHSMKSTVLRIMDLLSSIISLENTQINTKMGSIQCLQLFLKNLMSQEQEIKNFTYGLIGDITKNGYLLKGSNVQNHLDLIIKAIAQSIEMSHITSCNNGLLCLTDIIYQNQCSTQNYINDVLQTAVTIISKPNIQRIYCLNFAKIIGRLSDVNQEIGVKFVQQNLRLICNGLRTNQVSVQTDEAFRGIFKICRNYMQRVGDQFQYVIDAFICYPTHNQILRNLFILVLKDFRSRLSLQQWHGFLKKQIFLPATAVKINSLVA